jgi:hypothetical protein
MKLIFKKNEGAEISVLQNAGGVEKDFDYVGMVKTLIESKKLEAPDIIGNFTDAEKASIISMVTFINKELEDDSTDKDKLAL